ncbi:MAG: helix-turn-helix transcriptional regulator [Treponema sp.]|nr:helix-turn-helix transcriptional regulator [Treponema sp.]MCL2273160.1 helix-turn-helix transcriptional regulator [Treponema sp.]
MTFQELFIVNLKGYRKKRKFSQAKLAEICKSSQAYIAEIEVGKKFPSPEMIEKMASALGVESYYLFQSNTTADLRNLTPLQKQEIIKKLHESALKIINHY